MKNTDKKETVATPSMFVMQKFASDQHFVTPGEVANMFGYAIDTIISRLTESGFTGGRVYARMNELQIRYGVSANTMRGWLSGLEKAGKLHPIQGNPEREGAKGDTLYKIAEVDEGLQENRRAYRDRKEQAEKRRA